MLYFRVAFATCRTLVVAAALVTLSGLVPVQVALAQDDKPSIQQVVEERLRRQLERLRGKPASSPQSPAPAASASTPPVSAAPTSSPPASGVAQQSQQNSPLCPPARRAPVQNPLAVADVTTTRLLAKPIDYSKGGSRMAKDFIFVQPQIPGDQPRHLYEESTGQSMDPAFYARREYTFDPKKLAVRAAEINALAPEEQAAVLSNLLIHSRKFAGTYGVTELLKTFPQLRQFQYVWMVPVFTRVAGGSWQQFGPRDKPPGLRCVGDMDQFLRSPLQSRIPDLNHSDPDGLWQYSVIDSVPVSLPN